jgi:hypothetical protein
VPVDLTVLWLASHGRYATEFRHKLLPQAPQSRFTSQ